MDLREPLIPGAASAFVLAALTYATLAAAAFALAYGAALALG